MKNENEIPMKNMIEKLFQIVRELKQQYPGRHFTLDGHLVGSIVEAITSHRPYRAALGIDAALEEILLHRGTKYDAKVVDISLSFLKKMGIHFSHC